MPIPGLGGGGGGGLGGIMSFLGPLMKMIMPEIEKAMKGGGGGGDSAMTGDSKGSDPSAGAGGPMADMASAAGQ